jgi:hypothetical protein
MAQALMRGLGMSGATFGQPQAAFEEVLATDGKPPDHPSEHHMLETLLEG